MFTGENPPLSLGEAGLLPLTRLGGLYPLCLKYLQVGSATKPQSLFEADKGCGSNQELALARNSFRRVEIGHWSHNFSGFGGLEQSVD